MSESGMRHWMPKTVSPSTSGADLGASAPARAEPFRAAVFDTRMVTPMPPNELESVVSGRAVSYSSHFWNCVQSLVGLPRHKPTIPLMCLATVFCAACNATLHIPHKPDDYPRGQRANRSRITPLFEIGRICNPTRTESSGSLGRVPRSRLPNVTSPTSLTRQLANAVTAFYAAR